MPPVVASRARCLTAPGVALAVILLVGVGLRAVGVGDHLSDAEGYSYLVGSAPSAGAFLHRLAAYENTPPLFYLLLTPLPLGHAAWLRVPAAVPGALIPLVLYLALRRPLGARPALLAAALVAVAPYHVSYSDYARGFMLAGLGCMIALGAILRLVDRGSRWWWLVYLAGGVLAIYSEYYAAIFLLALILTSVALIPRVRVRSLLLGALPFVSLLPWLGQIERGQGALNHTKTSPVFPGPSLGALRDVTVRLVVGEHGAGSGRGVRWLEFLVVLAVLAGAAAVLRHGLARTESRARVTRPVFLLAGTGLLMIVGHALAPIVGLDLFNERYLTALIPIGAGLIATAVAQLKSRWAWPVSGLVVALVAVAVFVQRYEREYQPDLAPVRAAAAALHPQELLTNSAVVAYYLRGLHPILDRPFGLGAGLERRCVSRCLIVDDSRVPGGVRLGPGPSVKVGFFNLRLAAPTSTYPATGSLPRTWSRGTPRSPRSHPRVRTPTA